LLTLIKPEVDNGIYCTKVSPIPSDQWKDRFGKGCSGSSKEKTSCSFWPESYESVANTIGQLILEAAAVYLCFMLKETLRPHQPGESVFKAILSEDIEWKPFAAFPPSVRLAVVVGQPSEAGPYVIRVRVPHGVKLMPHKHPEDRIYTVISGVFYIGLGDEFDADKLQAYPPGAVIILPGNTSHFHWAKSGEYITQVSAIGPLGLEYVDSTDDPRNHAS
jgi:quercetin dioxygenase-like cupin family protein